MTWRMPGSKPWMMTTVGLMGTADWDEGGGNGILKYDDGTLWYWSGEMAYTSMEWDYYYYGIMINELAPGSKAWECISPDLWSESDINFHYEPGDSGQLIDGDGLWDSHMFVAHDGGDKSFWFPGWMIPNVNVIFVVSKENRSWEWRALDDDVVFAGLPYIWDGYVWYFTFDEIWQDGYYAGASQLWRMDMESPYTATVVRTIDDSQFSESRYVADPATGIPAWFDHPALARSDHASGMDDDGYFYRLSYYRDAPHEGDYESGGAAIWRMKVPDGEWELLYYYWVPSSVDNSGAASYNLPGPANNDRWHGPLPIGLGMTENWWHSKIGIRDGWLYYVDASSRFTMRFSGWTGGHMFCRIRLSDIEGGRVEHKPEDPIIEVLSMTTGPYDSFYSWDDTLVGNYGIEWRDGVNSIHAFIENSWYFDDDGSIVFLHHEYPQWLIAPGTFPPYVLSRLSPPGNLPVTFNLVFEGNEMKGYGHAREVPAKTKIGTIELSGE